MTACISTFPTGMPRPDMDAVSARSLCKDYGLHHALIDVDFNACPGQPTVLLGRNGAGKSTLLKCLAGILLPTTGNVSVCGEHEADRIRAAVGYVGESPCLDGQMTVAESLYMEMMIRERARSAGSFQEDLLRTIEFAGIGPLLGKKCGVLSKGHAQRVALALAMCGNPDVLVMDEFSSGLDPAQSASIRQVLKRLSQSKTVIISTHSIGDADALGGFIYVIAGGKVAGTGSAEDLIGMTGKKTLEEAFLELSQEEK